MRSNIYNSDGLRNDVVIEHRLRSHVMFHDLAVSVAILYIRNIIPE
jgi:hypothetical protein